MTCMCGNCMGYSRPPRPVPSAFLEVQACWRWELLKSNSSSAQPSPLKSPPHPRPQVGPCWPQSPLPRNASLKNLSRRDRNTEPVSGLALNRKTWEGRALSFPELHSSPRPQCLCGESPLPPGLFLAIFHLSSPPPFVLLSCLARVSPWMSPGGLE